MRYRVRHVTAYAYKEPVDLASHMLHLTPRELPGQRVLSAGLRITPEPSRVTAACDHYGNQATWVFLDQPHQRFEAVVEAEVDVAFAPPPRPIETPPWEEVAAAAFKGGPGAWDAAEFAFDSPMAPADISAGRYARHSFTPGRPVLEALLELNLRMRRDFTFRAGVTDVFTPVADVLARREGVCQDFTHVMISGLRALGLPARYTSGYLRTYPPAGSASRLGADQSHAWVGAWLGPAHGWIGLDPTNDLVVQSEHVVLAWGRDYGDISPVRGLILGGGRHSVTAAVELEPVLAVGA